MLIKKNMYVATIRPLPAVYSRVHFQLLFVRAALVTLAASLLSGVVAEFVFLLSGVVAEFV